LLGESKKGRQLLVEQANGLALRDGNWKYIAPGKGPRVNANTNTEMGSSTEPQLYDLAADIGEKKNLATEHPDRVKQMEAALQKIKNRG
jgi:arylsulfatase A-like enzyme